MPRSLAICGAETMLTSRICGFSTPLSAAAVIGLMLSARDIALVLDADAGDRVLGELAGERAERSPPACTHGVRRGASSAEIEGKLSALVISPVIR